uniref:Uncharacterized protein n=1 Tax=Arundo donax TaxID=35708 RepID=A0A0A9BQB6_ARUDO
MLIWPLLKELKLKFHLNS